MSPTLTVAIFFYCKTLVSVTASNTYLFKDRYTFSIFRGSQKTSQENKLATIWGNSCSSKDKIIDEILMPELNTGDWLIFHNMGHTISNASIFNGFKIGEVLDYYSNLITLR